MTKKSFILYDDMASPIEMLSDEDAGQLLKHVFAYRNNTNSIKPLEGGALIAFQFIRQQIDRDSEKWDKKAENSRKNGSKGGRPIKNPENPVGYFGNPEKPRKPSGVIEKPKKPVNGNVTVNVTDNVTVKLKNPNYVRMVDLLISHIEKNDPKYFNGKNKEAKRDKWYEPIRKLVEIDGRTIEEITKVIDWCQSDDFWKSNILSTDKLRKKFSSFIIKINTSTSAKESYRSLNIKKFEPLEVV